jgi:hypothetical protein
MEVIDHRILLLRQQKVMLDTDLARLYGVATKNLNKAVKRHPERFPEDFMFRLTRAETAGLRFQFGTSKKGRGGLRYLPYAFTEHGVVMLSSVLNSKRAAQVNIHVVRAFVRIRELLATNKGLARRIGQIERKQAKQGRQLGDVYSIVQDLVSPKDQPARRYGFPAALAAPVEITRQRLLPPASRHLTARQD